MPGFAILRPLISGLAATVLRFPLPLCATLLFCGTAISDNHNWLPDSMDDEFPGRLMTLAVLGFFWTLSARIFAESRDWANVRQFGLAAAGVGLLILKIFFDQPALQFGNVVFLALGPAMVLLVMAAPFLSRHSGSEAFWDFNRIAWLGAALAFLAALILASGLMFAIWAIEELFGWRISDRIEGDIWILAFSLFCPWLALARVPRRFDAPDGATCPRALSMLIAYVLVPLAIGYAVIVYGYLARILVLWELPRGQVATIVCSYAGFGLATYLAAWPLRDTGPVHVRLFQRFFFYALLPPVALLAVAVAERVMTYGVTEPRYVIGAIAVSMAAVTAVFLWKRDIRLPMVPAILAALMVAASFGPWGAADVSLRSQTARLSAILIDAGLMADGRVLPSSVEDAVSLEDRGEAVSIAKYLGRTGRLDALEGWFEDGVLQPESDAYAVLDAISPELDWTDAGRSEAIDYTADTIVPVTDYDLLLVPRMNRYDGDAEGEFTAPDGAVFRWSRQEYAGLFRLQLGEADEISFDFDALVDRMRDRYGEGWADEVSQSDMALDRRIGLYDVRLSVGHMNGAISDGRTVLWDVDIVLLLRIANDTVPPSADPG